MNPLKQGLKPLQENMYREFLPKVKEVNPLKQGLKHKSWCGWYT